MTMTRWNIRTQGITWMVLISLGFAIGVARAAPVYDVQGGLLRGIQGIDVGGSLYDVTFLDGEIQSVYNLANPFDFTTAGAASNAAQALSLALLDVAEGSFDSNPLLTFGCAADNCRIHVPYVFAFGFVTTEYFRNAANPADDERGSVDLLPTFDTRRTPNVLTRWQASQVPEPGSMALLALGLGLAGWCRQRSRP